jgi:hypothetical protein
MWAPRVRAADFVGLEHRCVIVYLVAAGDACHCESDPHFVLRKTNRITELKSS